jgi:hypothetical protein
MGSKFIRIYDKKYSNNLYPKDDILNNTSNIDDIYNYDTEKFKNFNDTPYFEDIIQKGEILI